MAKLTMIPADNLDVYPEDTEDDAEWVGILDSGLLQRLVRLALTETPCEDWEQELDDL